MENVAHIWFIVGVALVLSEFFLPGIILVFFGVAAILVALLAYLGVLTGLTGQLIVFTVLSLVLLFGLRRYLKSWFVGKTGDEGGSGVDIDEFIGKDAEVIEAIDGAGGYGKIEFKGANWKAASTVPIEVGKLVEIVRRDNLTIHVRPKGGTS